MRRKNKMAVVTVTALVMGLVAGCGKADVQESSQTSAGNEPVVLQWWGTFQEQQGPDQVCEAFNKLDPNIQVQYTRYVNDDAGNTKLDVTLMADSSVDVFLTMNDVLMKKRIDSGFTFPLDDLLSEQSMDMQTYYGDTAKQLMVDGHYHYMPAKRITSTILYNQRMFDEAGVAYPEPNWTYEEFLDAAQKLTRGEGQEKVYGYMFPGYDAGQPALRMLEAELGLNWMYTEDGQHANIDRPEVRDALEKYLDRVEKGIEPSYVDVTTQKMEPANMLLTEKAAMIFGDWCVRNVKDLKTYPHDFKVGFATMPRLNPDQKENYTTSLTDCMSISAKSEHHKEAMKFVKWYIEEGMDYVAPFARIPASATYDEEKMVDLLFGDQMDLFDEESAKSVYLKGTDFSIRTNLTAATEINTILTEEFSKAFAGVQSVDETIAKAQERAEEKVAEALKQ